jgi:ketosteroid isomerase-like protein
VSLVEELRQVEEAFAAAVEGGDAEAAEAILAEDFVLSSPEGMGRWVGRPEWFANLARMDVRGVGVSEIEPRQFGEVAVAGASVRLEASLGEDDLTGDYRVVDVFRRDGSTWRLAWRIAHRLTES